MIGREEDEAVRPGILALPTARLEGLDLSWLATHWRSAGAGSIVWNQDPPGHGFSVGKTVPSPCSGGIWT